MFLLKNLLKPLAFLFLLGWVIKIVTIVYTPKPDDYFQWARAPYFEKENTLEVVFVGSSHIEWGIDPYVLWEEYGIPAINYAVPGIDLKNSYFLLEELIKYHTPKVIVIDVYRICTTNDNVDVTNRIANVFPFSINKIEMINSNSQLNSFDKKLDYYFPLYLYHSRKLDISDFTNIKYKNIQRGHVINFDQNKEIIEVKDYNDTTQFDSSKLASIERVIAFSKKQNIPIVFIKTPNLKSDIEYVKQWNTLEKIAHRNNIPFINFNKSFYYTKTGIIHNKDMANDTQNNAHLNYLGAVKVSKYLGEFLKMKYNLKDKRNNKDYAFIDSSFKFYKEKVKELNPFLEGSKGYICKAGDEIKTNEYLTTSNKKYKLILQQDGNLVLYKESTPLWASNTINSAITKCVLQGDGNLVLYDNNNKAYWASNTVGFENAILELQNDGNLVLYKDNKPIWSSGTNERQ